MSDNLFLFENILNAIGYYICVYDKYGCIKYCNKAFKNAYLHGSDTFSGKHFSKIKSREYQNITGIPNILITHSKSSVQKKVENNGTFYIDTSPCFNNDGSIDYIVETIASPFKAPVLPLKEDVPNTPATDIFLGDVKMKGILETINRISKFDSTILITGESGTGKSMLANFIHSKSKRCNMPFVTINCAAIPENLIESELFGYVPGAFTGASPKGKKGLVEIADKGTLFLDEVGLLPQNCQAKFLQLIQEKIYTPIGAVKPKTTDIRIISATNLNLKKEISENKFREDLYYRLRVIEFYMPPLSERPDAIDPLIDYFLCQYNRMYSINKSLSPKAREILHSYTYKGNIRELQYIIERLIVTSAENQIMASDMPNLAETEPTPQNNSIENMDFETAVENYEKEILLKYFAKYKSTYKIAAALGITQSKVSRLMRKYQIN
ncbi:sigma 54-interacting transcriptional regulator [Anaerotignum faecicola]|nr:sigma 54-interacting transcriptional regulator [Anaerotignum faecicola]